MFEKTTFSNGFRVLTSVNPNVRSATVAMFVSAGSRYESDELGGAFHVIEHMCLKEPIECQPLKRLVKRLKVLVGL